ncbi:restriction endonuclease [Bacillus sp. FJAT-29814]|uniref:restriction endonuclease n=1 Tax=Bacillus sp. FJAT-29814 TaxID=1729688 RepID=UPI00083461F2|nr:restriction endonuclease [Bacillus sp. FJAT-29814]
MGRRRRRKNLKSLRQLEGLILIGIILYAFFQGLLNWFKEFINYLQFKIMQFTFLDWTMLAVAAITIVVVTFLLIQNHLVQKAERQREEEFIRHSQRKENLLMHAKADKLKSMQPFEFEKYIRDLFSMKGYETTLTPITGDGGKDIILRKGNDILIVECKRYNATKVTRPDIQKFHSAIMDMEAKEGLYVTTGYFTAPAIKYVLDKPIILIDLPRLLDLIEDVNKSIV